MPLLKPRRRFSKWWDEHERQSPHARGGLARRAYHEAGHAVIALDQGLTITQASIRFDAFGQPGGHVLADDPRWRGEYTAEGDLPAIAQQCLAGIAAESIVNLDAFPPASGKLDRAIETSMRMWTNLLFAGHGGGSISDLSKAAQCVPRAVPEGEGDADAWLVAQAQEAGRVLTRRWPEVETLRRGLMRRPGKPVLSGDDVRGILEGSGVWAT